MEDTLTVMMATGQNAPAVPVVVPRCIASVRLLDKLGSGTGGVVFRGYDEALGRPVAVKLLQVDAQGASSELGTSTVDGVRAASRVKHPNVVTIYAVHELAGLHAIVMELIEGCSLRELIIRCGASDTAMSAFIMRSVAQGTAALHEAGVVHRDLKPANVLFDADGEAHVCDFGLSRRVDQTQPAIGLGQVAGSPLYMAPESFDGLVSPQSDVYALGAMFFELLTGGPPFTGDSITRMRVRHRDEAVPIEQLAGIEPVDEISALIGRAMHKQRILRYKTATHFLRALEQLPLPAYAGPALRQRLAGAVFGRAHVPSGTPAPLEESVSRTTWDVLSAHARRKRTSRYS